MRVVPLLLALSVSTVLAAAPEAIRSDVHAAAVIGAARDQVLLMSPGVTSRPIAEALRRAVVERGVKLYLLVSPEFVDAPDSFVASLEALDGVSVRIALVDRAFALLGNGEEAVVLEGDLLNIAGRGIGASETYVLTDAEVARSRGTLFNDVWLAAPPYLSLVERLPYEQLRKGSAP